MPLDRFVRRAEAHFPALQRPVLSLRQRRRGAALQPAADRCRHDQAALTMSLEQFTVNASRRWAVWPSRGRSAPARSPPSILRRSPSCCGPNTAGSGLSLFLLVWVFLNCCLSCRAAPARHVGGAFAGAGRDPGRAVAVQVHHPLDGDQLLRRPDHRFRHHQLSCCSIFPDLRTIAHHCRAACRPGAWC